MFSRVSIVIVSDTGVGFLDYWQRFSVPVFAPLILSLAQIGIACGTDMRSWGNWAAYRCRKGECVLQGGLFLIGIAIKTVIVVL
jgi:peptidoglycan biosynthesis protein MviN/MurJ (putative lipid II flippase)